MRSPVGDSPPQQRRTRRGYRLGDAPPPTPCHARRPPPARIAGEHAASPPRRKTPALPPPPPVRITGNSPPPSTERPKNSRPPLRVQTAGTRRRPSPTRSRNLRTDALAARTDRREVTYRAPAAPEETAARTDRRERTAFLLLLRFGGGRREGVHGTVSPALQGRLSQVDGAAMGADRTRPRRMGGEQ